MELLKDKNSRFGILATILVHSLLLLMFLSFGMTYQDPPPPNEGSMMINFGTSNEGSGDVESEPASSSSSETTTPSENSSSRNEQVLTSDNSSAPEVLTPRTKPKLTKPEPTTNEETKPEKTKPEVSAEKKPTPSQNLLDALNAANNANSNSANGNQGNTGGSGNQGNPNGDRNSNGNSTAGNGIGYSLGGRGKISFKKPSNPTQKDGTVVVDIWVDKNGMVTKAKAGARGSTTAHPVLQKQAVEAAFQAKFKSDANAPFEQKGTMTFVFILN